MDTDLSLHFIALGLGVAVAVAILALIVHRALKKFGDYWSQLS